MTSVHEFADVTCTADADHQEPTQTSDAGSRAGSYSEFQGIPSNDASLQEAGKADKVMKTEEDAEVEGKPAPRRRCCRAMGCCICTFLLAVGTCVAIFWPRSPTWDLTKLDLADSAALDPFIRAYSGGPVDTAALPDIHLLAEVTLQNPNYLGGEAEDGQLLLFHREQQLGNGRFAATVVPPRSTVKLLVNVSVQLTPELLQSIASVLAADDLKLAVHVSATSLLRWPLGFRLPCAADCHVQASVVELMVPERRHRVVESQECSYRYF